MCGCSAKTQYTLCKVMVAQMMFLKPLMLILSVCEEAGNFSVMFLSSPLALHPVFSM
jgi:hypothetical protein